MTEQIKGGLESADLWNDDIAQGDRRENSFDDSRGNNPTTQDTRNSSGDAGDSAGGHDNPGDNDV